MEDITNARSRVIGARSPKELADADVKCSSALSRLLVISENYSDLKADQ